MRYTFRLLLTSICLIAFFCFRSTAGTAWADALCDNQESKLHAVLAQIDAHNAKPNEFTIPAQQAEANAYDLEANQLNTAKTAALNAYNECLRIEKQVLGKSGGPTLSLTLTPAQSKELQDAIARIPSNWQPPATIPRLPNGNAWVPKNSAIRPLYDALRKISPPSTNQIGNVPLQGVQRPNINDPDPGQAGRVISTAAGGGPMVSADHVVPLAELMQLPGFAKLSAQNMVAVANAPMNWQWLSAWTNMTKSSRSFPTPTVLDPNFTTAQGNLQAQIRPQLQQLINDLNSLQSM